MRLTRKIKIWLIVIAIPIVLLTGAAVALKLMFTSDKLKAMVIPRLEQATGRTASISAVHLSLFPSVAVNIDSLTIANRSGHGFSARPMLSLDRLILDLRVLPLLKGTLDVPTVILERPRILTEISKEGIRNYRSEAPPAGQRDTATSRSAPGAGFLISNFQIVDGQVEMVDMQEDSRTTLLGLNHQMRIEMVPGTRQAQVQGKTTLENVSYGTLKEMLISNLKLIVDYDLVYDLDRDVLTIARGVGTLQEIPLTVSGSAGRVSGDPELNMVIQSDQVTVPQLLSLAPPEYLKKAEGLRGSGTIKANIALGGVITDSTKADVSGAISASNATIQYAQLPKPITNIRLTAEFARTRTKQEFKLTQFSASLGNNPLSATMSLVDFKDPTFTLMANTSLNLAEVKEYYPLEEGTQLGGILTANVSITGRVSNPDAMKATGTMGLRDVHIATSGQKNPVEKLNGAIFFNNQILESNKLSLNLGKSDLALAFKVRDYLSLITQSTGGPRPVATGTLTSNHLSTADLTSEKSSAAASQAAGTKTSAFPLPNLTMDVSASIGALTMEKLELKNVRATMKILNGVVTLQNLTCNTFGGSVAARGALNLQQPQRPTYDLALDINAVDANALLSRFSSFGRLMHGSLTMSTSMKGALDDTLGLITKTLEGGGRVQVESGRLTGMKANGAIAGLLGLPDLEHINFKDWTNTFSVIEGRLKITDLKIAALGADYVVNGSQGLDGSLDYTVSLLLSQNFSTKVNVPGFAGDALNLLKDEHGRVKLDLTVGGTMDNPKTALDTRQARQRAEEAAKQKVADDAKKVRDQVKQKGQDLLKDIFKRKK